jgi:hypothetical protein
LKYLGLHNKPKAEVHAGHKMTGPKEEDMLHDLCFIFHKMSFISPFYLFFSVQAICLNTNPHPLKDNSAHFLSTLNLFKNKLIITTVLTTG